MTTETNKPTHILICTDGFANHRDTYPIFAGELDEAAKVVRFMNPEGHASLTRLQEWDRACASDRRSATRKLHRADRDEYMAAYVFVNN